MRDELLDAIVERLRERAGLESLALEIEKLISALRACETEEWEPQAGGEDRLRELMSEKLAAFRMRDPSMKALDPVWRRRAEAYQRAERHFRSAAIDFEALDRVRNPDRAHWTSAIQEVWMSRTFNGDTPPTPKVLEAHERKLTGALITAVLGARKPRGMALQLAYAAWAVPGQSLEDFRKKLDRIVARLRPHQ